MIGLSIRIAQVVVGMSEFRSAIILVDVKIDHELLNTHCFNLLAFFNWTEQHEISL